MRRAAWCWLLLAAAASGAGLGQAVERPSTAQAEGDALSSTQASCETLRDATQHLEGLGEERVDLSVTGLLTLVEFDGALAYLALCASPEPQVLCVTYSTNGMEVGDLVTASGNYRRPDPDYVLLDPCLASWPGQPERN